MSGEVTKQLLLLFALMVVGFGAKKMRLMDKPGADKLSAFIANVTMPCMYIATLMQRFTYDRMTAGFTVFGMAAVYYVIAIAIGMLFVKLTRPSQSDRGVLEFMIVFSNAAYMGYPVLMAIFTDAPAEAVFYGVFFNLPFNLLAFTYGVWRLRTADPNNKTPFGPKDAINPGTLSVFIGLIFFFISPLVPDVVYKVVYEGFIHDALNLLGNTTIPLSMVVIGTVLAEIDMKTAFGNWRVYAVAAIRLLLLPAIMLGVSRLLGLEYMVGGVPVVIAGMPCAVFAVILSKQYGGNEKTASVGVFLTTALSALTIPLLATFLR